MVYFILTKPTYLGTTVRKSKQANKKIILAMNPKEKNLNWNFKRLKFKNDLNSYPKYSRTNLKICRQSWLEPEWLNILFIIEQVSGYLIHKVGKRKKKRNSTKQIKLEPLYTLVIVSQAIFSQKKLTNI